jgi:hypothetical protein
VVEAKKPALIIDGRFVRFVVVLVVAAAGVAVAANRIGNNEANTLTGTDGNDNIYGLGSADTLNGLGGNDEISGNGGADTLNGGEGDDIVVGGAGVDMINTGNSTDFTNGQSGTDLFHSEDGNAETVCIGEGDQAGFWDGDLDTIVGPPNCTTVIFQPPSTAAATEAGNAGTGTMSSSTNLTAAPATGTADATAPAASIPPS